MAEAEATWRNHDWSKSKHPEREADYVSYSELVAADGGIIARVEQFTTNPKCFYATTPMLRSGCCRSLELAKQWCEERAGNKAK